MATRIADAIAKGSQWASVMSRLRKWLIYPRTFGRRKRLFAAMGLPVRASHLRPGTFFILQLTRYIAFFKLSAE
jgi:hypothetical protein